MARNSGRGPRAVLAGLIAALVLAGMLHAREAGAVDDATELAKKTKNPVADLISVPFQSNFNFNTGSKDATVYIMTANWEAESGDKWTVPVGGGVGKLFRLGKLPINTSLQAYYNAERPKNASDWQLRFQVQFLFPTFQ